MKTALIIATLLALTAVDASAFEVPTPVSRQLYTCAQSHLSRVALKMEAEACCVGMLGCPQLLGNTGFTRPKPANRT